MNNNKNSLQKLVLKNKSIFWSVAEENLQTLSLPVVIETILNSGDGENIRQLFKIVGLKKTKQIFFSQINKSRHNYSPQAVNFFKAYFKRHAPGNTN